MLTAEKKMITVTARQINAAANSIMNGYAVLAKDWAKKAADVAVNHHGTCEIEVGSTMATAIKNLGR
jgi:hypothetical protein